jgi:hypothetical protein
VRCLPRAPAFRSENLTVLVMSAPARVFLLGCGRTRGEDVGGERIGGRGARKSGASGTLAKVVSSGSGAAGLRRVLGVGSEVRIGVPSV